MIKMLQLFNQNNAKELTIKEKIIERLLASGYINTTEAVILMKTVDIRIEAQTLEMSSGAKIVGGSDFETTDFGR